MVIKAIIFKISYLQQIILVIRWLKNWNKIPWWINILSKVFVHSIYKSIPQLGKMRKLNVFFVSSNFTCTLYSPKCHSPAPIAFKGSAFEGEGVRCNKIA